MHWMYSKRRKEQEKEAARARGEVVVSGFVLEPPQEFRFQLLYALADAAPGDGGGFDFAGLNEAFYKLLHRLLVEEYGVGRLCRRSQPADARRDISSFVLDEADGTQLMDVVDTALKALDHIHSGQPYPPYGHVQSWTGFVHTVRTRLAEHRLPFDIVEGRVVSKDSEELHQAVVAPTAPSLFASARFSAGLLDAVDGEDVGTVVQIAAGVGDVGASREPDGADR